MGIHKAGNVFRSLFSGTVVFATTGWTMLIDSTPAPMATSAKPEATCPAADATACKPDAQNLFMVAPDVEAGNPAHKAAFLPIFMPVAPSPNPQPAITSSTSLGSIFALWTACSIACPSIAAPCVLLNPPLKDLARPVLAVEAMTTVRAAIFVWFWRRRRARRRRGWERGA